MKNMTKTPRVDALPAPGAWYRLNRVVMPRRLTDGPEWREDQW